MKESDLIFGLLASQKKAEYSFSDLAWLTAPFRVSETSLRTNLSRMVGSGVLKVRKEGRKAWYGFTPKSAQYSSHVSLGFRNPDWTHWDGRWWGISMTMPKQENSLRYRMTKKLAGHRFALMNPGFWIRPCHPLEQIEIRLREVFESPFATPLVFAFSRDEDLEAIPGLWKIDSINREFREGLAFLRESQGNDDLENPEVAFVRKMEVGDRVVKLLHKDPLLPDGFLPEDWQGGQLRRAFLEWDELVTRKSRPYWERIHQTP
ncbi:MAG: PaaX family transcriptional regulator C-terminal domain-containing protein [Bacteroidales bacterium]